VSNSLIRDLESRAKIKVESLRVDKSEFDRYFQKWSYDKIYIKNKEEKALEHFVAIKLLDFKKKDVFIDIASLNSPFPNVVSKTYGCKVYKQDLSYPAGVNRNVIGSDAAAMPLEAGSVSKMTLHCSFEHFEGDADTRFVKEAGRVLKPGGMVCILPLYLSKGYYIQNDPTVDRTGLVFDEGASIKEVAGWNNRFGRIYSVDKLKERIFNNCGDLEIKMYFLENTKDIHPDCYLNFILVLIKKAALNQNGPELPGIYELAKRALNRIRR